MFDSFFCSQGNANFSNLILIDGGVYDNYGYQTAIEILSGLNARREKLIIVIDSNADTEIPFSQKLKHSNPKVGIYTVSKAGFPARTSAYNRMFVKTANAI